MKIKKVVQLCKQSCILNLYDGDFQMLGDGNSVYYLLDCPEFSVATLMQTYDISDKQADKLVCNSFAAPPAAINVADVIRDEHLVERIGIDIVFRGKRYSPYQTSSGVSYIDRIYLEPFLSDHDDFELYERRGAEHEQYFAVKIGMMLQAVIIPAVLPESYAQALNELCSLENSCERVEISNA